MPSAVYDHLGSGQYSRLIYGAIIGLALTVALEHEEPDAAVMVGTLVGTGVAVGLTELYSEFVGAELRTRRRVDRAHFREIATNVAAVTFGASFPAIFFALAAGVAGTATRTALRRRDRTKRSPRREIRRKDPGGCVHDAHAGRRDRGRDHRRGAGDQRVGCGGSAAAPSSCGPASSRRRGHGSASSSPARS